MKPFLFYLVGLLIVFGSCQADRHKPTATDQRTKLSQAALLTYANHEAVLRQKIPISNFKNSIQAVLRQKQPIMLLEKKDVVRQDLFFAQAIAIADTTFTKQCFLPRTKESLMNIITDIRPAKRNDLRSAKLGGNLVLVEMYNFYYNTVIHAFVDEKSKQVLGVISAPGKQPNLTSKLKNIAQEIALAYPEVQAQLGVKGSTLSKDFTVVIRPSKCERSRHLSAAVTITKKEANQTLWVLVDLTELKAIGYQWMSLWNPKRPKLVTERSLQNEVIVNDFCKDTIQLTKGKWRINYTLTNSDGLAIFDVKFDGKQVLNLAKLVDWHVSYPNKKDFGYSDAMGCPKFSSAAVVAFEPPDIQPITNNNRDVGFSLVQDFRSPVWPKACNYRYQNLFEFYEDGRFRIAGVNLGLGCSNNGWYRPVFRIDLAGDGKQDVSIWKNSNWTKLKKESWHLQGKSTTYSPKGYLYQFKNSDGSGFYLEPNQGQFEDGSRGDHAYSYISVWQNDREEGQTDMSTIGPCCNTNFKQGPEKFIQPAEPLSGSNIIWYVPQMKNSDVVGKQYCWVVNRVVDGHEGFETYNGVVGAMFVPIVSAK